MINQKKDILKTTIISIILVTNIFLFVPFTLYIGNPEEFISPIWPILRLFSIPALSLLGLLIILGGILNKVAYQRFIIIVMVVGILLWGQGFILVWEYGVLDGSNVDWSQNSWRGWLDSIVWVSAIFIAIRFFDRIEKPVVNFFVLIFILQFMNLLYMGVKNYDQVFGKAELVSNEDVVKELYKFSTDKNVLHIILDGFQADVFKEIISDTTVEEKYKSALDGFVFYEEHMGVFPYTHMAVPAILSGEIYHNHMPKGEFVKTILEGKTFLNAAYEDGYEVDLVSDSTLMGKFYPKGKHTNAYVIPHNYHITDHVNLLRDTTVLLDLTLFRITPHFLKKYIYNKQRWLIQSFFLDAEYLQFFYFAQSVFLNNLTENMSQERTQPVYKLLHLMTTHAPFVVKGDCSYAGGSLVRNRVTVTAQSRCSLIYVIGLLERMKELDIYDDSLIIIMADHGAHLPTYRYKSETIEVDGSSYNKIHPWLVAMATPLMLLKTPGSSGPLKISTVPSSILDTAKTISSILELDEDFQWRSILELSSDEERERKYYYYEWRTDDLETTYYDSIQEFIINGSVYDSLSWRISSEYLPDK